MVLLNCRLAINGVYFRLLLSLPAKVIWKIAGTVMDMEWLRRHLLGLLKGENEAKVKSEAKIFASEVLPKWRNDSVFQRIESVRPVVLISATLSPVAKAIAEEMGAEAFFATRMEVVDGAFTGRIAADARNRKLELLCVSNYAPYLSDSAFMTDNLEDLPLLKAVKEGIAIADSPARQQFWLKQQVPRLTLLKSK